jgi:hypothetical protein
MILNILQGEDKRSGLIKDVNYLIQKNHTVNSALGVAVGIIASVITSLIIAFLG